METKESLDAAFNSFIKEHNLPVEHATTAFVEGYWFGAYKDNGPYGYGTSSPYGGNQVELSYCIEDGEWNVGAVDSFHSTVFDFFTKELTVADIYTILTKLSTTQEPVYTYVPWQYLVVGKDRTGEQSTSFTPMEQMKTENTMETNNNIKSIKKELKETKRELKNLRKELEHLKMHLTIIHTKQKEVAEDYVDFFAFGEYNGNNKERFNNGN